MQIIEGKDWELIKRITPKVMKGLSELGLIMPTNLSAIAAEIDLKDVPKETADKMVLSLLSMEIQKKVLAIISNPGDELKKFVETIFVVNEDFNSEDVDSAELLWAWSEVSELLKKKSPK